MQVRKDELVVLTSMYSLSCHKTRHTMVKRSARKAPLSSMRIWYRKPASPFFKGKFCREVY